MSREHDERSMGTADLVAGAESARHDAPEPARMRDDAMVTDVTATDVSARDMRARDVTARDASARDAELDARGRSQDLRDRQRADTAMQGTAAMAQQPTATGESLAALFEPNVAQDFHNRWNEVQIGFVDDPREAVRRADELVAQVMKSLAESFARQRSAIEGGVTGEGSGATEELRVALRRYRSFFERLLTL